MKNDFKQYLDFHKTHGGTGKIFKYKFLEYRKGFLKLKGEFPEETLNPNGTVQGGQMNSMMDDITSLLLIYESRGKEYPNSTNLHSLHHRPLFKGEAIGTRILGPVTRELRSKGQTKIISLAPEVL